MYSVVLINKDNAFLKAFMETFLERDCRLLQYPSLLDLYPDILTQEPLLVLVDGAFLEEHELGVINVLKRTFPDLKIVLSLSPAKRELGARAVSQGAAAYLLEPYFADEMRHLLANAFDEALRSRELSVDLRMEALSVFIQGLAPEMNNRLTPILGTLQILMGKTGTAPTGDEDLMENYRVMETEARRIERTVAELENFAKPRIPQKKPCSLKKILERAIAEASAESQNLVVIENENQSLVDRLLIDEKQVIQALGAILRFLKENADEDSGRVQIITRSLDQDRLHLSLEGFRTVTIEEQIRHAFIPLYLRNTVRFGLELGLASAYGLIKAHGGSLEAQATSSGTRFLVILPIA